MCFEQDLILKNRVKDSLDFFQKIDFVQSPTNVHTRGATPAAIVPTDRTGCRGNAPDFLVCL